MKLRKAETESTPVAQPTAGSAVIADRFKLDVAPAAGNDPSGIGKTAAMLALIGTLAAIALLGVTAVLMYTNWNAIANA